MTDEQQHTRSPLDDMTVADWEAHRASESPRTIQTNPLWERNDIQFPRLLCEIVATQDNLDLDLLAESMDLDAADVNELFDRAHQAWDAAKEQV